MFHFTSAFKTFRKTRTRGKIASQFYNLGNEYRAPKTDFFFDMEFISDVFWSRTISTNTSWVNLYITNLLNIKFSETWKMPEIRGNGMLAAQSLAVLIPLSLGVINWKRKSLPQSLSRPNSKVENYYIVYSELFNWLEKWNVFQS